MIERVEALILTKEDKIFKGAVDLLGNLTIGSHTFIADRDGRCRTIVNEKGEEITVDNVLIGLHSEIIARRLTNN